jgi:hypothetical protein
MSLVSEMVRRASVGGLDKPAAALAAFVVGAAVFAMPAGVLEQAVLASGMPDTLPQLSPPLGLKSRAGLALLSAGSAFGMVLLMMRIFGFVTKTRERPAQETETMPRVRRRDQHPDAPFRGPLSVSRDLGEPAAEQEPEPAPEVVPTPWPEPEPAIAVSEPVRPRPAGLGTKRRAPLIEVLAAGVVEEAKPVPVPAPVPEEPRRIKVGREAEPVAFEWEEEIPTIEPVEPVQHQPEPAIEAEIQPEPEPEPEPVAEAPAVWHASPEPQAQESLTELLARFERALERKSIQRAAAPAPEPAAEEGEGMDLRLRSALENLRKFAPRHG